MLSYYERETQTFKHKCWELDKLPEASCSHLQPTCNRAGLWATLIPSLSWAIFQTLQNDTVEHQPGSGGCVEGMGPSPRDGMQLPPSFELLDVIEHGDLKSHILKMMKPQDAKGPNPWTTP